MATQFFNLKIIRWYINNVSKFINGIKSFPINWDKGFFHGWGMSKKSKSMPLSGSVNFSAISLISL